MPPVTFPITLARQDGQVVLDGDLTFLDGGPAGLPAWFQSGAGDPVSANPTVPNTVGGLYFDTSGDSGLWAAAGPSHLDWLPLGNTDISSAVGLEYAIVSPGNVNVQLGAQGAGSTVTLFSGGNTEVTVADAALNVELGDGTIFSVNAGDSLSIPQHATAGGPAYVEGGMYYDTTLHKLRIGGAAGWETVTSV